MKRFALERSVRSEDRLPACLHVMRVAPFVSTQRRTVRPGNGSSASPGGDLGLAGETRL